MQGPQGNKGPQGDKGPQGEAGPSGQTTGANVQMTGYYGTSISSTVISEDDNLFEVIKKLVYRIEELENKIR